MSSGAPVSGILVGHGRMAEGMADALQVIAGEMAAEALVPLSNQGLGPDALRAAVDDIAGDGPLIVFTDLQSGSCAMVAQPRSAQKANLGRRFGRLIRLLLTATVVVSSTR